MLSSDINSGILRLTLDNPPANALSEALLDSLTSHLESAWQDDNIRLIVIASSGKIFSAGHDLKEMESHRSDSDSGKEYYNYLLTKCSSLMQSIVLHPKPIIAEVNGAATAAGCQLVATCDLAYASDTSTFCTPGVNIGLFCSTPMVALSRVVNPKRSMEMLLTGEPIPAQRAYEIGLLNDVVPESKLSGRVDEVCQKILSKSSVTLKIGKQAFYRQHEMTLSEAYNFATGVMVENMLDADAKEGIGAFLERRPPKWKNSSEKK